jgi:hypothetical protein
MADLVYNQQENTIVLWTKKLQMLLTGKNKKNKKMQVKLKIFNFIKHLIADILKYKGFF